MKTITLQFDDVYYQELINQVDKENLSEFFKKISEPYLWLNKKSLLSDDEINEEHKQILSERLESYKQDGNKGTSYKTVLLDIYTKLEQ